MPDYQQGKIYKLYVEGLEEFCYIGSTTESLSERLCKHRCQANKDNQKKTASCIMFQDDNNVLISLLELFPCNSKKELEERERHWLQQFPDAVNKNTPTQTWKERWEKNREHNAKKHKDWLEAHKEEEKEKQRQRRLADPEKAKAKDKASNANRDKAKRNEWKNKKVKCSGCNLIMSRNNFPTHKKNKHKDTEVSYELIETET